MTDRRDQEPAWIPNVPSLASFLYKYPRRRLPSSKKADRLMLCSYISDKLIHAVQAGIADDRERRCTSFCLQNGVFPLLKGTLT